MLKENNCQPEFHAQQKCPSKIQVKNLFSGKPMLNELLQVELTLGKEIISLKEIYRISDGRSLMTDGRKRNENG